MHRKRSSTAVYLSAKLGRRKREIFPSLDDQRQHDLPCWRLFVYYGTRLLVCSRWRLIPLGPSNMKYTPSGWRHLRPLCPSIVKFLCLLFASKNHAPPIPVLSISTRIHTWSFSECLFPRRGVLYTPTHSYASVLPSPLRIPPCRRSRKNQTHKVHESYPYPRDTSHPSSAPYLAIVQNMGGL